MQLAKFDNGLLITTYADDEDRELINLMVADGFKVYVEEQPQVIRYPNSNRKNCTTETRAFRLLDTMR